MRQDSSTLVAPRKLIIERRFNAPIERIFDAWTQAQLVEQWWGPEVMRTVVMSLDLRVGGKFFYKMTSLESGAVSKTAGTFTRIERPTRLTFDMTEHCNCDLGPDDEPQLDPTVVDVQFTAAGTSTLMVMTQIGLSSDAIVTRMDGGWSSSFGRLSDHGAALS